MDLRLFVEKFAFGFKSPCDVSKYAQTTATSMMFMRSLRFLHFHRSTYTEIDVNNLFNTMIKILFLNIV